MGVLGNIQNFFKEKRLNKLEKDLLSLRSRLQFDPKYMTGLDMNSPDRFSRRITEYKVWAMGNSYVLRRFYFGGLADSDLYVKLNYFWHKAPSDLRLVHCGIPGLISASMAKILFGAGVKTNVIVYKENSDSLKEDTVAEEKANEYIGELRKQMNFSEAIATAATNESWGGHCFFKFSHDSTISQYPILETVDITQAEVVKARGVTKAIVFKKWYEYNGHKYRLDEIYSVNKDGDATIQYRLFKRMADKEVEVALLSIPQTQELFTVGKSGNGSFVLDENGMFTYDGLKGMLAFEKPNKTPSLEFPNSNYGASDFEGAIDSFDALDEIYSGNISEVRENRTIRYYPDEMIPMENGEFKGLRDFSGNYVKVKSDADQNAENKIDIQQIPDKTESFLGKWKTAMTTVCNKAQISPYSIGVTWLETINPSAESQQERNKTTKDMRKEKLERWKPMIEEMLLRALQLSAWLRKKKIVYQPAFADIDYTWDNTTVQAEFGEYIEETVQSKLTTWGNAKLQRVASTETCVKEIHPEWTDKQVADEVNLIRFEDGMSTDSPDNLPTLTGYEEGDGDVTQGEDRNTSGGGVDDKR